MTATGSFVRCRVNGLHGHCRRGLDVQAVWNEIVPLLASREPVYALKSWRRVFQLELATGDTVYVKDIDETAHDKRGPLSRFLSTEATRYYRNHLRMQQLQVTTPELLFVLGTRRAGSWVRSVTVTRELGGYCCLVDAFERGAERDDFAAAKSEILTELATLAAKLHGLGYYFSLDGRNIFVRERLSPNRDNVALIDLDHIHRALGGRMPPRRARRNLKRFDATVRRLQSVSAADLELFTRTYAAEASRG